MDALSYRYSGAVQALFNSAALHETPGGVGEVAAGPADPRDADYAEHDRYFRVARVADRPAETFLRGLVLAHTWVYENGLRMGVTTLDMGEWQVLFTGLDTLLRFIGDYRTIPGDPVPVPTTPERLGDGYDPERRWLIGHQLFFTIQQGTIVGLNCFARAVASGDDTGATAALRVATAFMRSSGVAIKFCGDFGPVDYEARIRPAMAPPAVQAGFSGLQTRDHAFLVTLFGKLRSSRDLAGEAFEDFIDATVGTYEAHKYVCARFGGDILPSLRMAASSNGRRTQAGVTTLRQIMRRRLFALTGDGGWNRGDPA